MVSVPMNMVKKTKYSRVTKDGKTQVRYAFKAEFNGLKLTKFANQADWDKMSVPEV